ncbi:MAG: hypothetical protein WBS24_15740 [Terriglobales bacterium]
MKTRILVAVSIAACVLFLAVGSAAQDDGTSLGDFARNLRKNKAQQDAQQAPEPARTLPANTVIDNDNLGQVMEEAKKARPVVEAKTVLSIDSSGNKLKVMSPDATCSLSFNARASALLVKPALVEDLPLDQLVKLDGPGFIQDNNLRLDVFNATDWDLREITVGVTLERRPGNNAELAARARILPASKRGGMQSGVEPNAQQMERRSDVTLLYHLKTDTKAFSTAAIRENIGLTPQADEDWRWSIVEAKGIRPAGARTAPESLAQPLYVGQGGERKASSPQR